MNAPQYHWHVQGAVGADDEARHHIDVPHTEVALVWSPDRKKRDGVGTPAEQCSRFAWVEPQWTKSQEIWEAEYKKFIAELSTFVNKEINDF